MFTKSTYKLGDPVFMVVYGDRYRGEQFEVVRTLQGLKQKLKYCRGRNPKVYVCPDPAWFELNELTEDAIYACDEKTINTEVDRIRSLYGASE